MSIKSPEGPEPELAVGSDGVEAKPKVGGSSEETSMEDENEKMQRAAKQSAHRFLSTPRFNFHVKYDSRVLLCRFQSSLRQVGQVKGCLCYRTHESHIDSCGRFILPIQTIGFQFQPWHPSNECVNLPRLVLNGLQTPFA